MSWLAFNFNESSSTPTFIISESQKGFIKGRFIGENTRLLYDLMAYLEQHNKTGLLLLVD
jgi:hypothetical protein